MLERSHRIGESVTISHVFLNEKKLGGLALSGKSSIYFGDLGPGIRGKLKGYFEVKNDSLRQGRIQEFFLNDSEQEYKVVAEVLEPSSSLYIFGAGHVGQAVAAIGALAGYSVVVVDDRKEFLTSDRFPNPNIELCEQRYDQISQWIKIPKNSAIIIVTRGHQYDEICLRQVINMNTRYVGMIGSRRRVISIFQRLVKEGISKELLEKVHAPIGLKIGAISPQEIAVAIVAEVIDVMSNQGDERRLL